MVQGHVMNYMNCGYPNLLESEKFDEISVPEIRSSPFWDFPLHRSPRMNTVLPYSLYAAALGKGESVSAASALVPRRYPHGWCSFSARYMMIAICVHVVYIYTYTYRYTYIHCTYITCIDMYRHINISYTHSFSVYTWYVHTHIYTMVHTHIYIDIIYHHLSHIPIIAPQAGATPVFTAGLAMLVLKLPRVHRGTERGAAQEWRGAPGVLGPWPGQVFFWRF